MRYVYCLTTDRADEVKWILARESLTFTAETHFITTSSWGFPGGSVVKNWPANAGESGVLIPGLGRSPGGENGNTLQYSCLENSMERGAWLLQSIDLQRDAPEQLSTLFGLGVVVSRIYLMT